MTDEQIKHLVQRFLGWELPRNFNPDHGISFKNLFPHLPQHWPSGTNLFGYEDAEAMVRHMIDGMPAGNTRSASLSGARLREAAESVLRYYDPEREDVAKGVVDELRAALEAETPVFSPLSDEAVERVARAIEVAAKTNPNRFRDDPFNLAAEVAIEASASSDTSLITEAWQPIETAPKDGTRFLAWSQDLSGNDLEPFVSVCAWHPDAGFCTCEIRQPTHWQPFPAPPSNQPGERSDK